MELEDNVQWTIRGEDLAQADAIEDLDLGVTLDTHGIPSQVVDTVAGDGTVVQFTLAHEGAFGFPMTLTVPLGRDNAGAWAMRTRQPWTWRPPCGSPQTAPPSSP